MAYTISVTSYTDSSATIHITNTDAPSTPVTNFGVYVKEGTDWNNDSFATCVKTDANGDANVTGLVPGKTYGVWRQGAATASITPVTFTTTARDFKIPTAAQWQDLATRVKNAGGGSAGMTILSYGTSTYAEALAAYQAKELVYCRASSNSDPGSGNQLRMAFLAYVNDQTTPTEFEFQYYRSVSTKSDATQGDETFVYKLNQSTGWSVTKRNNYTKIVAGTGLSSTYSSGTLTINSDAPVITMTSTDPGEGVALAANNFIAVYDAS